MQAWPTAKELKDDVRCALDAVAARSRKSQSLNFDWTAEVFGEIKDRLPPPLGRHCQALRNTKLAQSKGFFDAEFLYDFAAHIYDDEIPEQDRFLTQTVVAGECEWHVRDPEEWDFHKLLQSDALLCFFVMKDEPWNIAPRFERLSRAIRNKQSARRSNGLSASSYLLSCRWNYPGEKEFWHRFIDSNGNQLTYDKQIRKWSSSIRILWNGNSFAR